MRIERRCRSEAETIELATVLGRRLTGGDVICIEGPLGCGKTCFVRGLAGGLGLEPQVVASPSFIICRRHATPRGLTLAHVDAFRLTGADDLESIGWEELLAGRDTVVVVEWPSRISEALPQRRIEVRMDHTGQTSRLVTITATGILATRLEGIDEHVTVIRRGVRGSGNRRAPTPEP